MILKNSIKFFLGLTFIFAAVWPSFAQDAAAGKQVSQKCLMCHSFEEGVNKIGPSLFGVVGRVPGTAPGFRYSPAMQEFGADGKVWTEERLNGYLLSPRTFVPGNRMGFAGVRDDQQRLDLIAYLKTLK